MQHQYHYQCLFLGRDDRHWLITNSQIEFEFSIEIVTISAPRRLNGTSRECTSAEGNECGRKIRYMGQQNGQENPKCCL